MDLAGSVTALSNVEHWPSCSDILAELLWCERDSNELLSQAVPRANPSGSPTITLPVEFPYSCEKGLTSLTRNSSLP